MSREQAAQYYATQYPERQRDAEEFFSDQIRQGASEYLARFLHKDMDILDYGCGPGGKLASLVKDGYRISGCDLNPAYQSFAESRGLRRFDPALKYDLIYLSHTIEHWTDPREDLQSIITASLRDGGRIVIEVPLLDRLVLGGRRNGIQGDTYFVHIWYFSVRSLNKLLGTLSCHPVYTDRLTMCVYECMKSSDPIPVKRTELTDALLRGAIAFCSWPLAAFVAGLVNRIVKYVDVSNARRLNPEA
jgi:SAM-dependent methyltransferase